MPFCTSRNTVKALGVWVWGLKNKFGEVVKFTNMESLNNEDQLDMEHGELARVSFPQLALSPRCEH